MPHRMNDDGIIMSAQRCACDRIDNNHFGGLAMKTLIVYYSLENSTLKAAEKIAEGIGADLCRIIPVEDVPAKGGKKFLHGGYLATFEKTAPIRPVKEDLSSYDRIIIGTPVWAGKSTPYICTFIEENKAIADKITALFTLSGSGKDDKCVAQLKKKAPGITTVATLYDMKYEKYAADNEERINSFIESLK